jgi:hypothetical protein
LSGYQVVTQALRNEAPKWDEFAASVAAIRGQVASATLEEFAFFVGDPIALAFSFDAKVHSQSYEKFRSFTEALLRGAETEFPQIGDALVEVATRYDEAEELVEFDLNEVYTV